MSGEPCPERKVDALVDGVPPPETVFGEAVTVGIGDDTQAVPARWRPSGLFHFRGSDGECGLFQAIPKGRAGGVHLLAKKRKAAHYGRPEFTSGIKSLRKTLRKGFLLSPHTSKNGISSPSKRHSPAK